MLQQQGKKFSDALLNIKKEQTFAPLSDEALEAQRAGLEVLVNKSFTSSTSIEEESIIQLLGPNFYSKFSKSAIKKVTEANYNNSVISPIEANLLLKELKATEKEQFLALQLANPKYYHDTDLKQTVCNNVSQFDWNLFLSYVSKAGYVHDLLLDPSFIITPLKAILSMVPLSVLWYWLKKLSLTSNTFQNEAIIKRLKKFLNIYKVFLLPVVNVSL